MTFKIETGIPIPEIGSRKSGISFALRALNVGDSFFIPEKGLNYTTGFVGQIRKSTGRQFACRTIDGGVRIWRIE